MRFLLGAALTAVVLTGCGAPAAPPAAEPTPTEIPASLALPAHPTGQAWRALALVPADATVVTITDFDAIRARFGVPDMTSGSPAAARADFWARARAGAVLFADGRRTDGSTPRVVESGVGGVVESGVGGVSADDIDWEVRFSGPKGTGYVVAVRPDLDLVPVQARLARTHVGATVMPQQHLVVKGVAGPDESVWAADPALPDLTDDRAESAYLRRGCVPVRTALGPTSEPDDQATLIGELDPRNLDEVPAFSVSFGEGLATARLGHDRGDLIARGRITRAWPVVKGARGFADGFGQQVLVDPSSGRVGLVPRSPQAARAVTLADLLPFAICDEIER